MADKKKGGDGKCRAEKVKAGGKAKAKRGNKLTDKQAKFVLEYLVDCNATQACIRAGYSKKNADVIGPELLGKTWVRAAIEKRQQKRADKLEITAERVLKEIARIALLDPRKFYNEDGSLKNIHTLDDDAAAAIAGMEFEAVFDGKGEDRSHVGTIHKIKLSSKTTALDMLNKHLGLYEKDNKQRSLLGDMTEADIDKELADLEK